MQIDDNNLTVTIDMPGFDKKDIKLKIQGNILSISAKKNNAEQLSGTIIWKQRPNVIDKKIRLPIRIKEGKENVKSAKYADGVLTIQIPVADGGKQISID
ncbi:MAG: Hsp20/alpha crystallin family protein [Thaumarchaeota archaeon]|nr:Hsp20/alpha crystallin family protein [Nitrososphaerota archaeon]